MAFHIPSARGVPKLCVNPAPVSKMCVPLWIVIARSSLVQPLRHLLRIPLVVQLQQPPQHLPPRRLVDRVAHASFVSASGTLPAWEGVVAGEGVGVDELALDLGGFVVDAGVDAADAEALVFFVADD